MRQSAGISGAAKAGALAMLLPFLALVGCTNHDKAMAEQLAAAQAAADKAVAAQHAAEQAAAAVANAHPAAAPEPAVVSDLPDGDNNDNADNGNSNNDSGNQVSMGGPGQTTAPNGTVIPGPG